MRSSFNIELTKSARRLGSYFTSSQVVVSGIPRLSSCCLNLRFANNSVSSWMSVTLHSWLVLVSTRVWVSSNLPGTNRRCSSGLLASTRRLLVPAVLRAYLVSTSIGWVCPNITARPEIVLLTTICENGPHRSEPSTICQEFWLFYRTPTPRKSRTARYTKTLGGLQDWRSSVSQSQLGHTVLKKPLPPSG